MRQDQIEVMECTEASEAGIAAVLQAWMDCSKKTANRLMKKHDGIVQRAIDLASFNYYPVLEIMKKEGAA